MSARARAIGALAAGVLVVATASILIRQAQDAGMSSIVIAAGRLGIATLVLAPFAWPSLRASLPALDRRTLLLALVAGLALAVHFAAWIASLEHTSVASSTALVTTNPLWVGLASVLVLRERVPAGAWIGIALTLAGSLVIVAADGTAAVRPGGGSALLGNGLALAGAVSASAYLLIGRALRVRLPLLAYVWLVYAMAAIVLCLAAMPEIASAPLPAPAAWGAVLALALGPQLLGHTAINHALRNLSATFTAVAILGEPIGSAILAWVLLDEAVTAGQAAGFAAIAAGIVVAAWAERGGRARG